MIDKIKHEEKNREFSRQEKIKPELVAQLLWSIATYSR